MRKSWQGIPQYDYDGMHARVRRSGLDYSVAVRLTPLDPDTGLRPGTYTLVACASGTL